MFGGKKGVIGIDIGTSGVKIGYAEKKGKKIIARFLWERDFPPDTVVEGEVMDRETVVQSLREFIEGHKIKTQNAASFLPANKGVILKRIRTEKMSEEEARESIKWNAEQHIPYDPTEVNMDVAIVNPDFGENEMEVILVAARSDIIAEYISLIKEAGMNPTVMDISVLALHNIFELNYAEEFEDEVVGLVHIGKNFSHILYTTTKKGPLIHRDLTSGTKDLIAMIQERFGITASQADDIIKGKEEEPREGMETLISSFGDFLSEEIEKTFPYLPGQEKPDRLFISGGGSLIPNISEHLREKHELPVDILNIFKKIELDDNLLTQGSMEKYNALFPLSVGVSLRGV